MAFHRLAQYDVSARPRGPASEAENFFFAVEGDSPALLLILAAWLLYRRRERFIAAVQSHPPDSLESGLGVVGIGLASALCLWAHTVGALGLLVPSISLMLLSGGLFLGGAAAVRGIALPALFLVLAFPHPAVLHNQVIFPMQLSTAEWAVASLELISVPATGFGDLIFTQKRGVFQVVETCAGLRSVETLLMASIVYSEVFHRSGRRRLLIILAAPPIGLLVNVLRVLSIILSPWSSLNDLHTTQGIVMLVVGVLLLAGFDALLGRIAGQRVDPETAPRAESSGSNVISVASQRRVMMLACVCVLLGLATHFVEPWIFERESATPLYRIATNLGERKASGLPLEEVFMGSVGYSEWLHRRYSRGEGDSGVTVFVAANDRLEPRSSLISRKSHMPGPGQVLIETQEVSLGNSGQTATRALFRSPFGETLAYYWYRDVESMGVEVLRSFLALDRGPWRRPGRAISVLVSVALPSDEAGRREAVANLSEVTELLIDEIDALERE